MADLSTVAVNLKDFVQKDLGRCSGRRDGGNVMHEYYWHGGKLKDYYSKLTGLKSVTIASAFISSHGVIALKEIVNRNSLDKGKVKVYLSPEFSEQFPSKILKELCEYSEAYIVYNIKFHPKVYLFNWDDAIQLVFGSSNLTKGGIEDNIEFDVIKQIDCDELNKINTFFDFCQNNSRLVDDEVIKFYQEKETELKKLITIRNQIKSVFYDFEKKDDPFTINEYDLEKFYFNYEDYETLFPRNQYRNDSIINSRRKAVQEKLLKIHELIYKEMKKKNLHCHWRDTNITSLIRPCVFNKHKVGWIGVRYGKSRNEIDKLNYGAKEDEELGFQKHACLQLSINPNSLEVNLFHAVPHDAVDRNYVHDQLYKPDFCKQLVSELKKLRGEGFIWWIYEPDDTNHSFEIDNSPPEKFIDFYKKFDDDGKESFLAYSLVPDTDEIKDINSIAKLVVDKTLKLLPLYNLLAFRVRASHPPTQDRQNPSSQSLS